MTRTLRLSTICLTIAAAAVLAPVAGAWTSNYFRNPSGNIQCGFIPNPGFRPNVNCRVLSNHRVGMMDTAGASIGRTNSWVGPKDGVYHVLGYGQRWQSHQFTCLSSFQGMRCWFGDGEHGFVVSAWRARAW